MSDDSLLQFPCDFPIKIMGERSDDFADQVLEIVCAHAPDFQAGQMQMRVSSGGKYLALTCTIRATSREQLDGLYLGLHAHPAVKVVL